MLCPTCKQHHPEKDFLPHQIECFRCVYKKKSSTRIVKKDKICPICNGVIFNKYKLVYCSDACADIGYNKVRHEKWGTKYVGYPGKF